MADTRQVKFGTFLTDPNAVVAQSKRGEELGYDILKLNTYLLRTTY